MKLLDIITAPWAILPDKLTEIQGIYATHLRGEKIDLKAIEAKLGEPLDNQADGYDVVNGVALLPLEGVLAKRMNLFTKISGGTSTELAAADFKEALDRTDVRAIVLAIDSPGGTIDGTQNLSRVIFEGRGRKPIVALVNGMMCSAAYWIGAAADEILLANDTSLVGSIGVVASHVDMSKMEEKAGFKTTEIVAGKFKRIASQYAPLTEAGRATMQEQVDHFYSVFVTDISTYRGVSVDTVLKEMADGRVFIGQQAIQAGLVDGVATEEQLINDLATGGTGAAFTVKENDMGKMVLEEPVTAAMLTEKCPSVIAEIQAAAAGTAREGGLKDGLAQGHASGLKEGAEIERKRIQEVEAQTMPGHEALIAKLKADGKTTGPEAAVQVLNAERALAKSRLADITGDAPAAVAQPPVSASDPKPSDEDRKEKIIKEHMAKETCDYRTAVLAVSKAHPELFKGI